MNKYDIEPCGHVPPYKRIMIGHDDPVRGEEDKEDDIKKCVRLLEEKRVWDLVVQSSSGSPIPAKIEACPMRAAAKKLFDGFAAELQKRGVPLLPLLPLDDEYVAKPDLRTLDWTRLADVE